jgi:DNA-binding Lrp family transcriptional regulator
MRKLQEDLPLSSTPFKDIAEEFQIKEETLFDFFAYLKTSQKMSRFAAILKHRNLGFNANAMVVWAIPATTIEPFAQYASAHASISHCYERVTYAEWPYNMYTMLHSTSREACQAIISELVSQFAVESYEVLYSIKEFKKQRIDYFGQEISEWHQQWME